MRYDQVAFYFIKSTKKIRFGVYLNDLPPDMRAELERNTGALIDVVVEDTPAFYSNIMAGDVLISIDDQLVRNAEHASELMAAVPDSKLSSNFLVIRKGEEKSIKVTF